MAVRTPHEVLEGTMLDGPLRYVASQALFSKSRLRFTPDLHELNHRMYHVVFIPKKLGSSLGGMRRFFEEPHVKYLGGAVTVSNAFQVMTCELGQRFTQNIVSDKETLRDTHILDRAHVEGFALAVPVSTVCGMDMAYNHGYQTTRQRKHIWLTAQKNTPAIPSLMWTYQRDYLTKAGINKRATTKLLYSGGIKQLTGKEVFV